MKLPDPVPVPTIRTGTDNLNLHELVDTFLLTSSLVTLLTCLCSLTVSTVQSFVDTSVPTQERGSRVFKGSRLGCRSGRHRGLDLRSSRESCWSVREDPRVCKTRSSRSPGRRGWDSSTVRSYHSSGSSTRGHAVVGFSDRGSSPRTPPHYTTTTTGSTWA